MNEERLTRRAIIAIIAVGVVTGVVALLVTMFAVGNVQPTYQAKGVLAMVVPKTVLVPKSASGPTAAETADDAQVREGYAKILDSGQATTVAAQIYKQPRFLAAAATAAGVSPANLTIATSAPAETSPLMEITVTGPSAAAAEAAAASVIKEGSVVVKQVVGPFDLPVLQDPAGSATPANVSASQLLIVALIGGLLVGSGAALIVARARSRSDSEPEYADSGEFRAEQNSGYGPPAAPPGRPSPGPSSNGGGQYGPPRRPAGDPRGQQPPR